MSKKANPTVVGVFIVAGLGLGVAGLVLFGSGKLFTRQQTFILYFDASVGGLSPGAPVKYRGVPIGSVVEAFIRHNQASNDFFMPVVIGIDEKMAQAKTDRQIKPGSREWAAQAIRLGLRGRLEAESLLTGVLHVELSQVPGAPPPVWHQLTPEYVEIPTVPTDIQELMSTLAHLDLRGISEKLNAVLARLDSSLGELNVRQINAGLTNLLASAGRVAGSPDLTNSLAELKQALADARALVRRLDNRVDPLADGVTNTLAQAQQTLAELRRGIQDLGAMIEPDARLRTDLSLTLEQLGNAANAIADLAEFLHRNPNSLLTGRKPRQIKP